MEFVGLIENHLPSFIMGNSMSACDYQMSGVYFWLQETLQLSNQIPLQNSVSMFCSVHLIFSIGRHISFQSIKNFFLPAAFSSECWGLPQEIKTQLTGNMVSLMVHLSAPDSRFVLAVIFARLAAHSKAELSTVPWNFINCVLLWAKYGERPIEDWPCQLGRSPTWLLGERLYPVLLKQDELGHECGPEALYPIYAACWPGSETCMISSGRSLWFAANHLSLQNDAF